MSWVDEQIRQRKKMDDQGFADSLREAAGTIMGMTDFSMRDDRLLTGDALEKILAYYHLAYHPAPDSVKGLEEQLEYILHPKGMMFRKVELTDGWQRDATGAFLAFRKKDGAPLAMIPSGFFGYRCYDPSAGTSFLVTKKNMEKVQREAYCFYRPLPQSKLSIPVLFKYILGSLHTSDLLLIFGVTLFAAMISRMIPGLTSILYGNVLESGKVQVLFAMAVLMICVRVSSLIIETGSGLISGCVQTRLQLDVESSVMMRVLSLPTDFFRDLNSGEISSRMASVNSLCSTLVNAVLTSGLTSLVSLLYIERIFHFTPALVMPSLAIIGSTVVFSMLMLLMETRRQKRIMEQEAKTTGLAFALINGIQKIRLAGAEKRAFSHWASFFNRSASEKYNPPTILKVQNVVTTAISLIGTIVLYGIAMASSVSLTDYMAFNAAYGLVMGAFTSLVSVIMVFARIKPVLDMAKPILDAVPETSERKRVITSLRGNIEMNNVTFRYTANGPKVIDNMSLKISAGEYVAIVGPSGCGKSTLMRLLLGFEKPERGGIFYDGRELDQIDLKSLRRKIGTVMQSGSLFNESIYANIALSAPSLTMEEAWQAAETASIADDIRAMPMGMFTMISEGEGGISGGQKQRLMIARAIAPKPSVLIFDEATSALDNIAQKKVTQALDALHCTRIVIAHRLSTIRSCSRILFLGDGRVLEEGTYEELMEKKGLFADMVARQQV